MKRENGATKPVISDTEKKLLELLITGASSKSIADQMGLKDGTTRVYLHSLYKRIGVNNKTSAVTWYLASQRGTDDPAAPPPRPSSEVETFGDRAVQQDLLSALGMMEVFLGPYGRMWDMFVQLTGESTPGLEPATKRARSRQLWNGLVRGDYTHSATYFDREGIARLFIESQSDAVVLAASLMLGGYTARAGKALASLKLKRGGSIGITADEKIALVAIGDVVNGNETERALAVLHRLADQVSQRPVFRHLVIVALFHLYKMRGPNTVARDIGNLVWLEAEKARNHLQVAGGDSTFPVDARLPSLPKLTKADMSQYLASTVS